MAGYFTAIVRAPITGIILITEMTGSFSNLLSLSIVSIISYIIADALKSEPIYDSLLKNLLTKNNINEYHNTSNKKIIITIDKHPTTYHCKHKYQYLKADMKQFFYYRHCITPLLMYRYYHEKNHFSGSSLQTKYIIFP